MLKYQNFHVTSAEGSFVGIVALYTAAEDSVSGWAHAWIQTGRLYGLDRSNIVDLMDIKQPLHMAIEEGDNLVQKHDLRGAETENSKRQLFWQYPHVAVREALTNAVLHADYSQHGAPKRVMIFDDRLEIENPGLLPFGLSLSNLPSGISESRNRVIGRVFNELGLVEQLLTVRRIRIDGKHSLGRIRNGSGSRI